MSHPRIRTLAGACLPLLVLVAGCGSDERVGGASIANGVAGVVVHVAPVQAVYPVASQVTLDATVADAAGAVLPDAKVSWRAEPPSAATAAGEGGAFTLNEVGPVTFTACAVDNLEACGSARIVVSRGAPLLVISAPKPGAEIVGDGASTFPVEGKVTSGPTTQVFVDGAPVTVAADGTFKADVPATFGVNHVVVTAESGLDPESRSEFDVIYGAAYATAVDADGAPAFASSDAIVLDLGQRFFDDGVGVPLDAPRPVTLPDVADVVTRVVAGMDVKGALPSPLMAGGGVDLTVTSAALTDVTVETELADDGLDLFVRVGKLALGTTGSLDLSGSTVSLNGGVEASLAAFAHAKVGKASPSAPVSVTVGTFEVVLETATGRFTDPQANAIFAVAAGYLRTTVQQMVKEALAGTLQTAVPQALGAVFQSLDSALAGVSFDIDAPPLPKLVLALDGHLGAIAFTPRDAMRAELSLAVKTDKARAVFPGSRGVALVDTRTESALFASPRTQLSVRLAVLNGLLHTLWNSGMFEIENPASLPVTVSAKLPPVVRLPRRGETDDFVISLGQLELVGGGDEAANGRLGVLLEAGVSIALVDDTLRLKLADQPSITVWTITEPQGTTLITPQFVRDVVNQLLWPQLRDGITAGLAIKLPVPPLDAIAGVAPSLAGLKLTTGLQRRPAYRNGFIVLDARIEAVLP